MEIASYKLLFTGGLTGNLGFLLFSFFLLLLPSLCFLFKGLRIGFPLLKFLQYPSLLIFCFFLFVFFLRQDRWQNSDWKDSFTQFSLYTSLTSNVISMFILRKSGSKLLLVIPFFLVLGVPLYFVI